MEHSTYRSIAVTRRSVGSGEMSANDIGDSQSSFGRFARLRCIGSGFDKRLLERSNRG
jgi:hypothetical protein